MSPIVKVVPALIMPVRHVLPRPRRRGRIRGFQIDYLGFTFLVRASIISLLISSNDIS